MDVQKYIDKMVLVPIERWNQLLDIEQKSFARNEDTLKTEEGNSQDEKHLSSDDVLEKGEIDEDHPPPPGIPANEISFPDTTKVKPMKKKRRIVKREQESVQHIKKKRQVAPVSGWLSLP